MISHNIFKIFSLSISSNRKILVMWLVIIAALIVDTSLANIIQNSITISNYSGFDWIFGIFIAISSIYSIGQIFILEFVKQKNKQIRAKNDLRLDTIFRLVRLVQYLSIGILVFVVSQMLVSSYYSVASLVTGIAISYILSISMLGLLAQRFFSWFRSNRNAVVLLYGLSSAALAINAALGLLDVSVVLQGMSPTVQPVHAVVTPMNFSPLGEMIDIINYAYTISSIVSFMITWAATALLLRHHSKKLGKAKYWIILSIPLVYYLAQFVTLFTNLFAPLIQPNPLFLSILLTLVFTSTKAAGGILFGVAFWVVAKSIRHTKIVRDYVIIAGYGLLLLFISNQAVTLISAPYPPFGLASTLFMGFSSYLVLVGIYSSAISVSQDDKVRQSIRTVATRLLDSIGTAQMEREIENRVTSLTKRFQDTLAEQTGIVSSLEEEDIKEYTKQVVEEIKSTRHQQEDDRREAK
jgi:hypothetical protein